MQTYELLVKDREVLPNSEDVTLVRTSVGVDAIHVLFDNDEWTDFPITVTFANGDAAVSQSLTVSPVESDEWALEGGCAVPWEVIREVGSIRVTFQGTDAEGRHLVTAAGAPLSVEEAGDVELGEVPEDAPTVDQWSQAYADAMAAVNALAAKEAEVDAALSGLESEATRIATTSQAGMVMPDGETVTVDGDGTIHAAAAPELAPATADSLGGVTVDGETIEVDEAGELSLASALRSAVANLRRLASIAFDSTFNAAGDLSAATVKAASLPVATASSHGSVKPDGSTITVASDGTISAAAGGYSLPAASTSALGGVIVGDGLAIDAAGVLSVDIPDGDEVGY